VPRPRAAMRKIRDVLRLRHAEHLSTRAIAAATRPPRTTVRHYLDRASEAGLSWPLPAETDDRELEERLFGRAAPPPLSSARPVPDWEMVHREMHRPHVTLQLLWTEYRERCPDGYGYTWFTEGYATFRAHLDVVMRQEHRAGEKLFIDFAGSTIPIVDRATGRDQPRRTVRRRPGSQQLHVCRSAAQPEACRTGWPPTSAASTF
jgi:transposase